MSASKKYCDDDDDDDDDGGGGGGCGFQTDGAITVHSDVAPPGELRGKGRCGVFAGITV